jgi:hypothetical protein
MYDFVYDSVCDLLPKVVSNFILDLFSSNVKADGSIGA